MTATTISTWRDATRAAQTHTTATEARHTTSASGEPEGSPAENTAPTTAAPNNALKAEFRNVCIVAGNRNVAIEPRKNVAAAINPQ